MLKVGVVDSGFREDQIEWIEDAASFYLKDARLWMGDPEFDQIDHGCRIIDIIHHHCPEIELYSAQVFDRQGVTSPAQVAAAINWLCDQKVNLINLSLGLRQHRENLAEAVQRALSEGVIVCASSPARGDPVYPSGYPGVFRMTGDARCSIDEITCLETEFADFGGHVLGLDQEQAKAGSSLGCAHMSGHVAKLLSENPDLEFEAVGNALKKRASYFGPEHRLY
ncbi:S8 family serine peptidase [Neptuniibacter sp.]|uniref:subtilisin-like serine protease QhpE n=1 Tax=Neptuniibacter sp. TaxID=1962643 RepID=UPI0026357D4F|nr:S8 family serine peptidase [Neptuniibacter sp.]MCP4595976.1 S8 family serine peptidase [Neptuniibacter sp.]